MHETFDLPLFLLLWGFRTLISAVTIVFGYVTWNTWKQNKPAGFVMGLLLFSCLSIAWAMVFKLPELLGVS